MNTGVAYMQSAFLQRLNSEGKVLYEEEFSILKPFPGYGGITPLALSLMSTQEAEERYQAFLTWLQSTIDGPSSSKLSFSTSDSEIEVRTPSQSTSEELVFSFSGQVSVDLPVKVDGQTNLGISFSGTDSQVGLSLEIVNYLLQSTEYLELDSISCPLPNSNWEKKDFLKINTTLKYTENGQKVLSSSFDKVGVFAGASYGVEFLLVDGEIGFTELDYLSGSQGELLYKSEIERRSLVFDINKKGELIVIGEDADHYSLNEMGELIYTY